MELDLTPPTSDQRQVLEAGLSAEERRVLLALQHDGLRDPVWDEHTAIAQAVAQGDAEHAEALMREHSHQASLYLGAQAAPAASAPSPDNSVVR